MRGLGFLFYFSKLTGIKHLICFMAGQDGYAESHEYRFIWLATRL